jgi:signal transduction histidine kinase
MSSLMDRLDPRRSLGAAVGWALTVITLVAATIASVSFAVIARDRIEEQIGAIFRQYATQISNELDINLYAKLQWISATASVFENDGLAQATPRRDRLLRAFRSSLPELDWIGIARADGRLIASSVSVGEETDVSKKPWFTEGRSAPWLGDVRTTGLVAQPAASTNASVSFIEIGAPIRDPLGKLRGVIGARLGLEWTRSLETSLTDSLRANRAVETLLVGRDGTVLLGPKSLIGQRIRGLPQALASQALRAVDRATAAHKVPPSDATSGQFVTFWPDGNAYLAGFAVSDGVGGYPGGIGWTVWVREETKSAFAPVRAQQLRIFGTMAIFGMLTAAFGVIAARRLTRRLAHIARSADDIREGRSGALDVPQGEDEAARIGHSLQNLLAELDRRSSALEALNAELDQRVAARTREVERMAEENRHAAIVRERLRLARDMHDTLAQSMMALLTEIRLMRKLAHTNPAALKDELARAEEAAHEGLQKARAAIAQLRLDAVRDIGLGAGLRQLLTRMEGLGIKVDYDADRECEAMADSRAEILCRIAAEALRNIERHAHADHIKVLLKHSDQTATGGPTSIELRITDNGVGFDTGKKWFDAHFGLHGMREHADMIHATLVVESKSDEGTRITVKAPL